MRFLFIADPVEKLKVKSDTSFAFLREALKQGHEVYWAIDRGVSAESHRVFIESSQILYCAPDGMPESTPAPMMPIEKFDVVLIRKDPPFDMNYIQMCWVLMYAESKVYFMNRPSLLVRYHEKILPLEAVAQGFLREDDIIPTFFGNWNAAKRYFKEKKTEKVIVKPFWGFGGSDITLLPISEFMKRTEEEGALRDQIVQPFLPEIVHGDRRVFLLDGQVICDVVRVPKEGSIISNLAQGGSAVKREIGDKEMEALTRLGKFLKYAGIHLAGADVIGNKISECNITSPTGIRSIEMLEGKDFSEEIVRFASKCAFYGRT